MKAVSGNAVLIALVLMTIGVYPGSAQVTAQLTFKMSESFVVGNATLPAGSYTIRPVSGTDQAVIEIASTKGKPAVIAEVELIQPDRAQNGNHLVFNRYKNVLALSQIFPGGGNQGYQLVPGHPEKMAAKSEKPTKQTVASTSK
jgi:hypothetical protein